MKAYDVGYNMGSKNLNSETQAKRNEWKGKAVSHKASLGHRSPHALKSSERGRMILDFGVQSGESKLTM